jgi:TRAP-type mannitol/chloroaromatic compound transport system permease small subunit
MKKFLSAINTISTGMGKISSWITIAVVAVLTYEVVMRYVFNAPTRWASETMGFCCGLIYVLGGAWVFLENRHVKIEFLYERLNPRQRAVLDVITFFFFALYMGLMLWATSKFAWESIQLLERSGSPWNPPVYPIKIALVTGVFLVFLQGSAKLIHDIHLAVTGKKYEY